MDAFDADFAVTYPWPEICNTVVMCGVRREIDDDHVTFTGGTFSTLGFVIFRFDRDDAVMSHIQQFAP